MVVLIDFILQVFILEVQLFDYINELSQLLGQRLLSLRDLVQLSNGLSVILIYSDLMLANELHVFTHTLAHLGKDLPYILVCSLFDVCA